MYDVGSKDENPKATGLAHLFEHLMFTGSKNAPNFDAPLQAAGGSSNAWTSVDITNYYETLPAQNVETAFWLESDRLRYLNLTDESIDTQKSVVIEEFKQRCLNVPYGDLYHFCNDLAYKVHPYRWPTIGLSVDDIKNASHEDIKSFFAQHYAVNNLILCVSGHIEFEKAVALTEKWFGDFAPANIPVRNLPQEPVQTEQRFMSVKREVPQNVLTMMYHMCGRCDADYQVCDMLSDVLSNGMSSRFYRNVLVKSGLFTELDASVSGTYDPGLFIVRARLASGVAPTILDEYVMLLRRLFKTQESNEVFAGAYLTGILPIKKYNTESALNNFREYSMITPGRMANALGFTHDEVMKLCQSYCMDIKEMEQWYDGYRIGRALSISSLSVISMAVGFRRGDIKWNHNFSPKQRSPASPRPGTMYLCSLSCGSMAPHHTVVLSLGNVLRM